jgi:hypothetical protein
MIIAINEGGEGEACDIQYSGIECLKGDQTISGVQIGNYPSCIGRNWRLCPKPAIILERMVTTKSNVLEKQPRSPNLFPRNDVHFETLAQQTTSQRTSHTLANDL